VKTSSFAVRCCRVRVCLSKLLDVCWYPAVVFYVPCSNEGLAPAPAVVSPALDRLVVGLGYRGRMRVSAAPFAALSLMLAIAMLCLQIV
jgi:hypothetical protein